MEFMLMVNIPCRNGKTVFKVKLPIFQHKSSTMPQNIFRKCEACLEAAIQHFESLV